MFLLDIWHTEPGWINQSLLTEVSERWRTRAGAIRQHNLGRAGYDSSVLAPLREPEPVYITWGV